MLHKYIFIFGQKNVILKSYIFKKIHQTIFFFLQPKAVKNNNLFVRAIISKTETLFHIIVRIL